MDWTQVALVAAGSAGPLIITLVTLRNNRMLEAERRGREERDETLDACARFVAAATQVVADWGDVVSFPPAGPAEERALDERRDVHYAELNSVSALVRLTGEADVVAAAEALLGRVRQAASVARARPDPAEWPEVEADFAGARDAFVAVVRARTRG